MAEKELCSSGSNFLDLFLLGAFCDQAIQYHLSKKPDRR